VFYGDVCKQHHTQTGLCSKLKVCKLCVKAYGVKPNRNIHQWGEKYCINCENMMPCNHLCYIRPSANIIISVKKWLMVFYDIECRQDEVVREGVNEHVPNLLVSRQV